MISLIMRDQGVEPRKVLLGSEIYPSERLWGYRELLKVLGESGVDLYYMPLLKKDSSKIYKLLRYIMVKVFGDMYLSMSLIKWIYNRRDKIDAIFISDNRGIFTLLIMRFLPIFHYRVCPLLLGWAEFNIPNMPYLFRIIWLNVLSSAHSILVLSPKEIDALAKYGLHNVKFLDFGVDPNFWCPGEDVQGDYIFTVGADPLRDYETFIASTRDMPVVLCAPPHLVKDIELGKNVKLVQGSQLDVRHWFREARVVVIPVHDTLRPSGQGSALQAMATGKAVVMTKTKSEWSDLLIDQENCILVPPGDIDALRSSISSLYHDEERAKIIGQRARQTVLEHFTTNNLIQSIISNTIM